MSCVSFNDVLRLQSLSIFYRAGVIQPTGGKYHPKEEYMSHLERLREAIAQEIAVVRSNLITEYTYEGQAHVQ